MINFRISLGGNESLKVSLGVQTGETPRSLVLRVQDWQIIAVIGAGVVVAVCAASVIYKGVNMLRFSFQARNARVMV